MQKKSSIAHQSIGSHLEGAIVKERERCFTLRGQHCGYFATVYRSKLLKKLFVELTQEWGTLFFGGSSREKKERDPHHFERTLSQPRNGL